MSKIVFLDVDGTLVDYENHLPDSAVIAIRAARANGHRVYICTGRSRAEVYPELWDIGFDGMIGGNGISKATAVDALLRHLGVSREDTIAFGDAKVDIPMFEVCAYSVCMGSGGEEAKAAADYATSGVNEDGLFRAFQALHLIDAPAPSESN